MKTSFRIHRTIRQTFSLALRYSLSQRFSDMLLWPVSRRLFGRGYEETVEIKSGLFMKVYGDMEDMVNKTLLFMSGFQPLAWEPATARLVDALSHHIQCAVVAGAHIGYYPLIIAAANPKAEIWAFEPDPFNYKRLMENLSLQPTRHNVIAKPVALGDADGRQAMYFDFGQSSLVDTARPHAQKGIVPVTTLDHLFEDQTVLPDLIVLDAEGYEPHILRGAGATIGRVHPDIIFELNPKTLHAAKSSPEALCALLLDRGYAIFLIEDDYRHRMNGAFNTTVKLVPYAGVLPDSVSFVNAFATVHPERIRAYL